jgi:protein-disulfide isomerase
MGMILFACGGAPTPAAQPVAPGPVSAVEPSRAPSAAEGAIADSDPDGESPVPVAADDPVRGSRTAPVTIVMFGDFQCPFTARVQATIDQLEATFAPGQVRIVWKNYPLPFHPNARPAAEVAVGVFALAGNDAFWKFHAMMFKNQERLGTDNYVSWAARLGVDGAKLRQGLEAHTWAEKVDRDIALANTTGAQGTPHFFINGVALSGAQPLDKFVELTKAELAKAQAEVAKGGSPERIYLKMSQGNFTKPLPKKEGLTQEEEDKTIWRVPVGTSPVNGPDTALVTIVEFADFQCPFCKRVLDTLKRVRDTYGDKVRFVWKNEPMPFHPRAEPAAELAEYAFKARGNAGFWAVHERLFELHPTLEDTNLESVAKASGLDVTAAMQAVHGHSFKNVIDADADLADDVKASGVPHFFINGRRLVGSQPFEKFQTLIDQQLEQAKAMVTGGTPAKKVYEQILKTATGPAPLVRKDVPLPTRPAPSRGASRAKVVIQEFADFQCPFSKRARSTMTEILTTYGNKVKIVFRQRPLAMHPDAGLAAEAALEAFKQKGAEGFWRMHDLLFENQDGADGLKQPALVGYANVIGLDVKAFLAALETHSHQAEIDADIAVADAAGINGTPEFVINGYYVTGAQPFTKFRRIIDRALAEAK